VKFAGNDTQPLTPPYRSHPKKPAAVPPVTAPAARQFHAASDPFDIDPFYMDPAELEPVELPSSRSGQPSSDRPVDRPVRNAARTPFKPATQPIKEREVWTIGDRIRALRQDRGLSQIELGDMLHVSGTTVSFWETGKSPVRPSYMQALARSLNVTEEFLRGQ